MRPTVAIFVSWVLLTFVQVNADNSNQHDFDTIELSGEAEIVTVAKSEKERRMKEEMEIERQRKLMYHLEQEVNREKQVVRSLIGQVKELKLRTSRFEGQMKKDLTLLPVLQEKFRQLDMNQERDNTCKQRLQTLETKQNKAGKDLMQMKEKLFGKQDAIPNNLGPPTKGLLVDLATKFGKMHDVVIFLNNSKDKIKEEIGQIRLSIRSLSRSKCQQCCGKVGFDKYGDLRKLSPTGLSSKSAQMYDTFSGVKGSDRLLDYNYKTLKKRYKCYKRVGENHCVHPALIAAIASRQSRGGIDVNRTSGCETGVGGQFYGIMQCNLKISGVNCKRYRWNSCTHINQAVQEVLIPFIKQVQHKHPKWSKEQQLQGGVVAYGFGLDNVQTVARLDIGSSRNDFSNDIMARAQRLIDHYGW